MTRRGVIAGAYLVLESSTLVTLLIGQTEVNQQAQEATRCGNCIAYNSRHLDRVEGARKTSEQREIGFSEGREVRKVRRSRERS